MRTIMQGESAFTIVEMMVVLILISILAVMATVTLSSSSDRVYVAAMQSDLRNIAAAQEAYIEQRFAETGEARYADRLGDLDLNLSNGVQIRLRGNRTGWSARATHQRATDRRCSMLRGTIRAFPPASDEGKIVCD